MHVGSTRASSSRSLTLVYHVTSSRKIIMFLLIELHHFRFGGWRPSRSLLIRLSPKVTWYVLAWVGVHMTGLSFRGERERSPPLS